MTPVTPVAPAATSIPIQQAAAVPTYAPGSDRLNAFNWFNAQRVMCGFGALNQHASLDQSAQNMADYVRNGYQVTPHRQTPGTPGFTGVTTTDRAIAAGYNSPGPEVVEVSSQYSGGRNLNYGPPAEVITQSYMSAVRGLFSAPYHGLAMLLPFTEVGIANSANVTLVNGMQDYNIAVNVNMGYGSTTNGQLPPAGSGVRTFPCQGVTDVVPALYGEYSAGQPLTPGRMLNTNPIGHPIYVVGEVGKTLALTSAQITQVSTGASVALYAIRVKSNDPNGDIYYRNDWSGYVMPDAPLISGQQYRVVINGTFGGTPFIKDFTFSVGNERAV